MAAGWPTKANYATGDVLSATNMNDLSGTVNLINPSAKGDLYAGSAANTYTKLAVGTNNQVLTADSSTATGLKWATASSGGKFAQIVQATTTSQATITSTSYVTTNFTATITPTATSSKVLIQATIPFWGPGSGVSIYFTIFRGTVASGTDLSPTNVLLWGIPAQNQTGALLYLDSPSTTSAQVYTIAARVGSGTGYFTNTGSNAVLTLTEVLA